MEWRYIMNETMPDAIKVLCFECRNIMDVRVREFFHKLDGGIEELIISVNPCKCIGDKNK